MVAAIFAAIFAIFAAWSVTGFVIVDFCVACYCFETGFFFAGCLDFACSQARRQLRHAAAALFGGPRPDGVAQDCTVIFRPCSFCRCLFPGAPRSAMNMCACTRIESSKHAPRA